MTRFVFAGPFRYISNGEHSLQQLWRNLFWIWGPLGVLTGALAIVSIIVEWFGVSLAPTPDGLLWLYRQTVDRLFHFSIEWWAVIWWPEFNLPDALKDVIAIYLLMVAVILRDGILKSRSANTDFGTNLLENLNIKQVRQRFRLAAFGKALFAPEFYWRATGRLIEDFRYNRMLFGNESEIALVFRKRGLNDIILQLGFMYLPLIGAVSFFVWNGILLRAP